MDWLSSALAALTGASGITGFAGAAALKTIFGELVGHIQRRADHKQEMERLEKSEKAEQAAHDRRKEIIELEHTKGLKVVTVKAEFDARAQGVEIWGEGVRATMRTVGVPWIDGWNAGIRPAMASIALTLLTLQAFGAVDLDEMQQAWIGAIIGLFVADRDL
ncbi:MAG: hypothetical protein ACRCXD_01650, partial [Luteolibacter sp.]